MSIRRALVVSLVALGPLLGAAPAEESVLLTATEDAYVVSDVSTTDDPLGLRERNFGSPEFVKIWYAFQVQDEQQLVSLGLFKFDLTPLADKDIRSASLQLFALRTDLAQPARLVDVTLAEGDWSEQQVAFNRLPAVNPSALATAAVYGTNLWYSWDVTSGVVRQARGGTTTFLVGLRALENKKEEQVVFASREAGRNAPRLVVTYAAPAPVVPLHLLAGGGMGAGLLAFGLGLLIGTRARMQRAVKHPAASGSALPAAATLSQPEWGEESGVPQGRTAGLLARRRPPARVVRGVAGQDGSVVPGAQLESTMIRKSRKLHSSSSVRNARVSDEPT